MKRFNAILFSFLLVWAQLLAAPALACSRQPAHACCHCGGKMSCCAAQPSPCSQSAPAVPAPSGIQNQFSFLAPVLMIWSLPENEAGSISFAFVSPLTASGAPLYARDCARLI
ncbi:MAG: hypothetical protein ABSF10_03265 [Verrucomicrobiota bacterium]